MSTNPRTRPVVALTCAVALAAACSSSAPERADPPPTAAAKRPSPMHRFDVPVAAGEGAPRPLFVVEGAPHDLFLLVSTRGAPSDACAAPLPQAIGAVRSAWTLPATTPEALFNRPDLLAGFSPEEDERFDAQLRAHLSDPGAVDAWDQVIGHRDALLKRLEAQRRFMDEARYADTRKVLSSHLIALTTLETSASSWPTVAACVDEVLPARPLLQRVPLDDEARAAIDQHLLKGAAGPAVAAHAAAALSAADQPPPHLNDPSPVAPFSLRAWEQAQGHPQEGRGQALAMLRAQAASFIEARARAEPTLLLLDAEVLGGDDGVLQRLLNAGHQARQLRASASLPSAPPLATSPLAFVPLDVATQPVEVSALEVNPLWAAAGAPRRLRRITGEVFSFADDKVGDQPGRVHSFLVGPGASTPVDLVPLELPDQHHVFSAQPGASLVSWKDDEMARFAALDHSDGSLLQLEGQTRLSELGFKDARHLLLTRVADTHPGAPPRFWVRLGLHAEPVAVEGLVTAPYTKFPQFHVVEDAVILGDAEEQAKADCFLVKVSAQRATCIATRFAEAKAFKDRRRSLVLQRAPRTKRGAPPPARQWVHDQVRGRRFSVPGARWMPISGRQYDFRTSVLRRGSPRNDPSVQELLYSGGRLHSFSGRMDRCATTTMPDGAERIFCDYAAGEGAPLRRVLLSEDAGTALLLPEGFEYRASLYKFVAASTEGDRLLFVDGERPRIFTGLPVCAAGWRPQGRPFGGWVGLQCAGPAPVQSLLLHIETAHARRPPAGWAFGGLREDGRAVFSDAVVSERRNPVSKLGITAPLSVPGAKADR